MRQVQTSPCSVTNLQTSSASCRLVQCDWLLLQSGLTDRAEPTLCCTVQQRAIATVSAADTSWLAAGTAEIITAEQGSLLSDRAHTKQSADALLAFESAGSETFAASC